MEGILKFDLLEESEYFKVATHAADFYMALYELDQQLRTWCKHGHKFENADDALDGIREMLWDTLAENNVSFDMLS